MMKLEYLEDARNELVKHWEAAGTEVIRQAEAIGNAMGSISFKEFLNDCTACGGDWGGMLLTGIKRRWPAVWDAIPEHMGVFAFADIMYTLMLCGVDTAE